MKYKKFIIRNYKGIKYLELDLDLNPDYKIYTLVGLNESGKTTVLEAVNDFEFEVPEHQRHLLIPKSEAGGFTGKTIIEAILSFSDDDKQRIEEFVLSRNKAYKFVVIDDDLTLVQSYSFTNSLPGQAKKTPSPFIRVRKTAKAKPTDLEKDLSDDLWKYLKQNLFPEIIYYRDFLSKFPEKIWLTPSETKEEKEYTSIIEDVLTSINPAYNVKGSLLNRITNPTDANKQALEAVENELGAKISQVVFDAWNKIQNVSKKEIVAKTGQENGRHYIRLNVKEGHQTYAVAERSLGFRWFFTFLLYTEFRKERIKTSGEILFLLDEPASNLHQTAQKNLLDTFEKITSKSRLVYTTHSHHLINPMWLNSAYIIRNKGLKYKDNDDFTASKTEIEAYKYKQFVSSYPKETSYFQPILDVLDYQPGLLEEVPQVVITEGKFDYFVLKYFGQIVFSIETYGLSIYPGRGATQLDIPIRLYESWGRNYLVLLDSDTEGRKQKERYVKEFNNAERVVTLEDISSEYKNVATEGLFTVAEKLEIAREFNPTLNTFNKSAFHTGIQTLYSEKRVPDYLTQETKQRFKQVLSFLKSRVG